MSNTTDFETRDELCPHPEDYERERLDGIYDIIAPYSEMAKNERYFLNGVIRCLKPAKILEVGVASGGGTSIILNAIKDLPHSHLTSVDYCERFYNCNSYRTGKHGGTTEKLSGYIVDEKFPELKDKWTIYRGGDISEFIERVGGDIDLLMLDTAHAHPWETLNFLCVLPFMKLNHSWVVLHDISLNIIEGREDDLACRYLFSNVVSDERVMPVSDYDTLFANIGAFHVTDDTVKYVRNLFESLLSTWSVPVPPEDLESIRHIISKYYPEYVSFFDGAIEFQDIIARHKHEMYMRDYGSTKAKLKRYFPLSYAVYSGVRKILAR